MTNNTIAGEKFRAGLVQMCSGRTVDANVTAAVALIREAAAGGAQYVQTPEVTTLMELDRERLFAACQPEEGNEALAAFQSVAHALGIWLHIGSIPVRVTPDKLANRSFLISPAGEIAARYDKIHMFDVELANGESYRESENYKAGEEAVIAATPWGGLGLTICYDLRFPYLFRALAHGGASLLAVPAAFTRTTGEAHWHTLLRSRAIEAQCFVLAAAQGGQHEHGRSTYGHSVIISPWGEVLAEGGTEPGVVFADLDLGQVAQVRARVPSLRHDRSFTVTTQAMTAPMES
ncbi:Predicted amidohydrolase [Filomicrobium insigne]|uniref:Predicted amidohydrolase n=1 Tax=Filomicrobium insigne TaxID=418854 RepID=A0A1H0TP88_9HYPH|nr:carbon-nitrogen hydrolase family protein [Filomicrobium insigne]SDP55857.1 Predicted amidohydrolase [Filomicrobium insigne]